MHHRFVVFFALLIKVVIYSMKIWPVGWLATIYYVGSTEMQIGWCRSYILPTTLRSCRTHQPIEFGHFSKGIQNSKHVDDLSCTSFNVASFRNVMLNVISCSNCCVMLIRFFRFVMVKNENNTYTSYIYILFKIKTIKIALFFICFKSFAFCRFCFN